MYSKQKNVQCSAEKGSVIWSEPNIRSSAAPKVRLVTKVMLEKQNNIPPKTCLPHCNLLLGSRGVPKSLDKNTVLSGEGSNH